jgi:hypothetical protein
MANDGAGFAQLFEELSRRGLLLDADVTLPSVARIVIGGPWRGSWWSHPLSNRIYMLGRELEHHPDVLFVPFISTKMTYIHRRLWSDFYAIASARQAWQFEGLSESASLLLELVNRAGHLRTDEIRQRSGGHSIGDDARSLGARLLLFSREVHLEGGRHAKVLETWEQWAGRTGFSPAPVSAETARARFDQMIAELNSECSGRAFMPWNRTSKRARRA